MDISQEILSEFVVFSKYAKYIPELQRRETWDEICNRYEKMMLDRYPQLSGDIISNMIYVRRKKLLPSMRAMQFAGAAIEKNESRIYNCAFLPVDHYKAFSETMFLLLGGTGVGYSVQYQHVAQLPALVKPTGTKKYIIADSIEGWADAVKTLMKAYFGYRKTKPVFDFSDIRHKGARLVTAGGKAPGPDPLKACLEKIEEILKYATEYQVRLTPIQCHDIQCHIANAVLAGGIRRAAMISLFSANDEQMLTCKSGNWWENNEQRGRANNSVILERGKVTKEEFLAIWDKVKDSGAGEPGIYWTNNLDWGTNPCCEIALRPFQFCNLTEVNVSDVNTQHELNTRVKAASFLGTLQAGFTNFHYLRDIWRKTTEEDALIGVGMTGIGSGKILNLNLKEAANVAKETNKDFASVIGISSAARVTTIKPSGTTSCVLGTSSGIHAWHNDYYIRRIRLGKNEAVYTYLSIYHPDLIEDDYFRPDTQAVLSIPQRAPKGSILRTETALDLLERTKKFNLEWVKEGHVRGDNTNNVSATISIDADRTYISEYERHPDVDEWFKVGEWMWDNQSVYNGLSVLPADNGSYTQAPFSDCTEEEYNELAKNLTGIDLSKVVELDDLTDLAGEAACQGGNCEIK